MTLQEVPQSVQTVEEKLQSKRIYCIASGEADGAMKFYMHAQETTKKLKILIELQISGKTLQASIKSGNEEDAQHFKDYLESIVNDGLQ